MYWMSCELGVVEVEDCAAALGRAEGHSRLLRMRRWKNMVVYRIWMVACAVGVAILVQMAFYERTVRSERTKTQPHETLKGQ